MVHAKVIIPAGAGELEGIPKYQLDLFYVRNNFSADDTVKDAIGYIQSGRNNPGGEKTTFYEKHFPKYAEAFAKSLQDELSDANIDIIVVAPSSRNFHVPWCEAASARLGVEMVAPFHKPDNFFAGENGTYEETVKALTLEEDKLPKDIAERQNILIFDDTISNGNTAAAIITHLAPRVHANAIFRLACILRLPGVG